jgi:hypothetical protein
VAVGPISRRLRLRGKGYEMLCCFWCVSVGRVGGVEARRLVLTLYDVFASAYRELYSLVEGFDEDLSRGL